MKTMTAEETAKNEATEILKKKLNTEFLTFSGRELIVPAMIEFSDLQHAALIAENERLQKEVEQIKQDNRSLTNQVHHDDNTICNFNDVIKEQQKELSELNAKYSETLKLFEELKQVALRCSDEVEYLRPLKIKHLAVVMENAGLKRDNEKMQNESFGFIIRGYYNRIVMNKPSVETITEWLESDLQEIKQEDVLLMAKQILNESLNTPKP